jgi:signal transduction histidine kinase
MTPKPKVNILLVDDQHAKLLSYQAILESLDENLVVASSGREALQHLLRDEFAVILVDVCMPEQDGFELVAMIRAHHRFQRTAIIFVSAIQMTDLDLMRGYATGAVDYVSVPIIPEILRAKVSVFVDLFRKTRELEELNAELEARVIERTARLTETEEALREASRRKDAFLATLAHELRNPIAPLRSAIDLISLSVAQNPEVAPTIPVMDRQINQLTRLIDDLMDLSRINRGKLELRKATVELSTLVQGAIETALPAINESQHAFNVTVPPAEVFVEADPERMSQVLSNLLLNASKYTPFRGRIVLDVSTDGKSVEFKVTDDGVGIETHELTLVFEPFYQIRPAEGNFRTGLGIGLTLAKTIVELHGGIVAVDSAGPNKGSEFTVKIPCFTKSETPKAAPREQTLRGAYESVLIVDDNRDAADLLQMLFSRDGIKTFVASDGEAALKLAEEHRPDVILMDVGMPGMDGLSAAREIRAREWGGSMTLAAVTGWGQTEYRRKTQEAGFDYHFVKPIRYEELVAALATHKSPPSPTGA